MASITINIPDDQVVRLREAFGIKLNLGRPATPAEIKQWMIGRTLDVLKRIEEDQASKTAHETALAALPVAPTLT